MMGLSARFVAINVALLFIVLFCISAWVIGRHAAELRRENAARAETLRDSVHSKGQRRARILATFAHRAAEASPEEQARELPYLAEVISATVKNDPETAYGIVMDNDRRALVHTDPKLVGTILDDRASLLTQKLAAMGEVEVDGVLDIAAPIMGPKGRFGTIRFGIYTSALEKQIATAEAQVDAVIDSGIRTTLWGAALLLVLGTLLGTVTARRLMRPLSELGAAADALRRGELDRRVPVRGGVELERLATAFNDMASAIAERDARISAQLQEVKQALDKEATANRARAELLANVSHELRTPLNAIVNVPITLLEVLDVPEEHKRMLRRVEQSGKHLLRVVDDLLDAAKLDASKMTLKMTTFDTLPFLEGVIESMRGLAEARRQQLTYDGSDAPRRLNGDSVRLTQVLINLIGNAIKFTPEGGAIHVRAWLLDGEARFSVKDTGPGIPPSELENVFLSFRQLDGGHTRQHGGTGLGLTISRQLVELHRGKIWCESALGKGTTFIFSIPRSELEVPVAPATIPKNLRSVLYVEDEDLNWEVAEHALRSRYQLTRARNATETFATLQGRAFDAILMDIQLKGSTLDGIALTRELKKISRIPVIFVTAYGSSYSKETLQEAGGADVLTKPVDFASLSLTLTRVMMRELKTS